MKLTEFYNLEIKNSELAKEWHPTKNNDLLPNEVTPSSGKRVWWLCKNGHEWMVSIHSRSHGSGCPYCYGKIVSSGNNLFKSNVLLASQWHPIKNENLTPYDVTHSSNKKVWWLCENNHEWMATINNRAKGKGCPFCFGRFPTENNNLLFLFPDIANQWHPVKNMDLTPKDVLSGAEKKVWWLCKEGHEWESYIYSRTGPKKQGCPYCAGIKVMPTNNLLIKNPNLAKQWNIDKNGSLNSTDVLSSSSKKVWWLCENGHEWNASINSRSRGNGCPFCSKRVSKLCKQWLDGLNITDREVYIKTKENYYYVDGFNSTNNIIYEFLGDYWHGNPLKFNFWVLNNSTGKTFGELFTNTLNKFIDLYLHEYTLIYKWERASFNFNFDGQNLEY